MFVNRLGYGVSKKSNVSMYIKKFGCYMVVLCSTILLFIHNGQFVFDINAEDRVLRVDPNLKFLGLYPTACLEDGRFAGRKGLKAESYQSIHLSSVYDVVSDERATTALCEICGVWGRSILPGIYEAVMSGGVRDW